MNGFFSPAFIIFILLCVTIILGVILAFELKKRSTVRRKSNDSSDDAVAMSKGLTDYSHAIIKASISVFTDKSQFSHLLQIINSSFSLLTKADGAILLTPDEASGFLQTRAYEGYFPPAIQVPKSLINDSSSVANYYHANGHSKRSIFGSIMELGQPEIIANVVADKRIYVNEVETDEKVLQSYSGEDDKQYLKASSYMFIPLKCNLTCIGVIGLAKKYQSEIFTTQDFELAKILSKFTNTALNNVFTFDSISEERNTVLQSTIATDLQKNIFCKNYPYLPNMSIDSYFYGSEGVCSDYFDVIQARKDRVCFILADVIGRGMKSLMLSTMIRGMFRILTNTSQAGATILSWINKGIIQDKSMVNFANLSFIEYNPLNDVLRCTTAGSSTILYFESSTKNWENLSTPSEPLGIDVATEYTEVTRTLQANDIVILCTDGIIETVNSMGMQYGQKRLQERIRKFAHLSTKEITEKVKSDLLDFEGNIRSNEDRSLVILKGKQK